jgi:hypothetical protein
MRKPGNTAASLSATANQFMREDEPDEDELNREGSGEEGEGEGDPAGAAISAIAEQLIHKGPAAVHLLRKFTQALEQMGDACMAKDHARLEEAGDEATQVLGRLICE